MPISSQQTVLDKHKEKKRPKQIVFLEATKTKEAKKRNTQRLNTEEKKRY